MPDGSLREDVNNGEEMKKREEEYEIWILIG